MSKARLEAFSDGVFSIVMTLLAIELHPFDLQGWGDFLPFLPMFLLFILSFITTAIWWVNHHQLCLSIKTVDHSILWLNTITLLFITLIPFSTSLLGKNFGQSLATAFYNFNMFLAGGVFYFLTVAVHGNLKKFGWQRYVGVICYGMGTLLAFLYQPLAYVVMLIPPIFYFIPRSARMK